MEYQWFALNTDLLVEARLQKAGSPPVIPKHLAQNSASSSQPRGSLPLKIFGNFRRHFRSSGLSEEWHLVGKGQRRCWPPYHAQDGTV